MRLYFRHIYQNFDSATGGFMICRLCGGKVIEQIVANSKYAWWNRFLIPDYKSEAEKHLISNHLGELVENEL